MVEVYTGFSQSDYIDNNRELDGTTAKITALRTRISDNLWSITVMLVNDLRETPAKPNKLYFSTFINVSSEKNEFVFVETELNDDPKQWMMKNIHLSCNIDTKSVWYRSWCFS